MAGIIISVEDLAAFLGIDADEEALQVISGLRASAMEDLCRSTGIDWTKREKVETLNEALRAQVWLSYYAVRDGTKNTQFLQEYLTGLVCSLQLCKGEEDGVGI